MQPTNLENLHLTALQLRGHLIGLMHVADGITYANDTPHARDACEALDAMLRVAVTLGGDMTTATEKAMDAARKASPTIPPAPQTSTGTGKSLPELVTRWKAAQARKEALSYEPGGENMDTPEQEALDAEAEALAAQIARTVPRSILDLAALLEWMDADSLGLESVCNLTRAALANAIHAARHAYTWGK